MRDYDNHSKGITIVLGLTDRRGRMIRASMTRHLKIRVWTQDPNCYLSYGIRDIDQRRDEDMLHIPEFDMNTLQSGVVIYQYSFDEFEDRHDHHHHDDHHYHDDRHDRVQTVTTDIFWRNGSYHNQPSNPINFQSLENLKDLVEHEREDRIRAIRDLYRFMKEEYPDRLTEESKRAQGAEKALDRKIGEVSENQKGLEERLDKDEKAALTYYKSILDQIKGLQDDVKKNAGSASGAVDAESSRAKEAEKRLDDKIEEEIKRAKKAESALGERISEELEKKTLLDTEQTKAIEAEVSRAKGEEDRIEGKIDTLKQNARKRLKAVEGDLADAEEKIKANAEGIADNKAAIKTLRNDATNALKTLKTDLEIETKRAKAEEDRISRQADENTRAVEAEKSRASLVEKDLAQSLQALKQTVGGNQTVTDAKLEALKQEMLDESDRRIKDIIGTAPEAFDTLGEIADQLSKDNDAIKAINGVLSGKVNADEVYKKQIIDARLAEIKNIITQEIQRAELAEKKNADAIAIINGDADTIGSILHAVKDSNHYTDDEIRKIRKSLEDGYVPLDVYKLFAEETLKALDDKQPKGDYVAYLTGGDGRKHILLPNHVNILGTLQDGSDSPNLIMMSKWNVCDIGSVKVPVNLNGLKPRPTYNDDHELALMEDVDAIQAIPLEEIRKWVEK